MKVDYGWISTLLAGSMSFTYYDTNNVARPLTDNFNIKFIDVKFNTNQVMLDPWFIITNAPSSPNPSYFTFATSEAGPYSSNLSVDLNSIAANGTLRIYVRVPDNGNVDLQVRSRIRLTPGGNWSPPYWESEQFGYLLSKAVKSITFQQYDEDGTARSATNNFQIGSTDVIVQADRTVASATITIADLAGSQSNGSMVYALSPSGPWSASLQWVTGLNAGNNTRRIYIKPASFGATTRVSSKATVTVAWAGTSLAESDQTKGYSTRVYQNQRMIRLNVSAENWYGGYLKLNNGNVTPYLSVAGDNTLRSVTEYVTGETWNANIETHNAHDDFDVLQSWTHNFPGIKVPGLRYAQSMSASVTKVSGRNDPPSIVQQPSAGNGYTIEFKGRDDSSGEADYLIDVFLTVNW